MAEIHLLVCDPCADDDRRTEATNTLRLTIEGQPIRLDVCAEHDRELGAAVALIQRLGQPDTAPLPSAKRKRTSTPAPRKSAAELLRYPGATGCPVCFRLMSTPGNASHHIRKIHLRKPEEWTTEEREQATREARHRLARAEGIAADSDQRHLSPVPSDQ